MAGYQNHEHLIPVDREGAKSNRVNTSPNCPGSLPHSGDFMDYGKEVKALEAAKELDKTPWLELGSGQHKVKFLSEGEEYQHEYDGQMRDKVRFTIEYKGERHLLSAGKGSTTSSLYGQLMLVAAKVEPENLMTGKVATIIVKSVVDKGKAKREFTILEALPFMKQPEATASK